MAKPKGKHTYSVSQYVEFDSTTENFTDKIFIFVLKTLYVKLNHTSKQNYVQPKKLGPCRIGRHWPPLKRMTDIHFQQFLFALFRRKLKRSVSAHGPRMVRAWTSRGPRMDRAWTAHGPRLDRLDHTWTEKSILHNCPSNFGT